MRSSPTFSPANPSSSAKNPRALVTLTLGDHYRHLFETLCRDNWSAYAARHGYDLIVFDRPLDNSSRAARRSPAWQKCLILEQPEVLGYRQVVWLDSDMLINHTLAPAISEGVAETEVGATDAYGHPTPALFQHVLARVYADWRRRGVRFVDNLTAAQFYSHRKLTPQPWVAHTGAMVAAPAHHAALFRRAYDTHEDMGSPEWNYEMGFLSWELVRAGVARPLDSRFNIMVGDEIAAHYGFLATPLFAPFFAPEHQATAAQTLQRHLVRHCLKAMFAGAWFLHFTGMQDLIERSLAMHLVLEDT